MKENTIDHQGDYNKKQVLNCVPNRMDIAGNYSSDSDGKTDVAKIICIKDLEASDADDTDKANNCKITLCNQLSRSEVAVLENNVHVPKWLRFIEYPFKIGVTKVIFLVSALSSGSKAKDMAPMLINYEVEGETKEEINSISNSERDEEDGIVNANKSEEIVVTKVKNAVNNNSASEKVGIVSSSDLSPSEIAVLENNVHVPKWLRFIEYPFKIRSDKGDFLPEATGWSMDATARGPVNQAGTYFGACLLTLASAQAGCNGMVCGEDNRIYGMKPSSLLTTVTAVVSVVAALVMPLTGAVVDHSSHRKTIGVATAIAVLIATGAQIGISESNWFVILCLEAVGGFSLIVHTTSVFSYMPDLSLVESQIVKYSTGFHIRRYTVSGIFTAACTLYSFLSKVDGDRIGNQIRLCRFAASFSFSIAVVLFGYAWIFCFRKRPPSRKKPAEKSLMAIGFSSVSKTFGRIFSCVSKYRALKWLMISMLFSPESGAGTVLSIATTFLTVYLRMKALQLSITVFIMFVAQIPGSIIGKLLCNRFNPFVSYRASLAAFAVSAAITVVVLNPERIWLVYVLSGIWGCAFGCFYSTQRVLFCKLIPSGKQFEFMGFFAFFGNLLSWLPPILFTILNEQGVSMKIGFSLLPAFSFVSLFFSLFMGSYSDAVEAAAVMEEESEEFGADMISHQEKTKQTAQTSSRDGSENEPIFVKNIGDKGDLKGGCRRSPANKGPFTGI
eukprot:CAMPEP_0194228652 /NCGR_PEP_ID=MMETSP0156-20130528/43481_1 /TAXON_ID=33649 /ORGANISM="Thalassionema nitzschioides, Strain L26-B" /LENGTH=727 /DNA_ID=CAMNT_0038961171 /DNA_START=36 /DNA_END=2220 /DNA_ORIENTATION=-